MFINVSLNQGDNFNLAFVLFDFNYQEIINESKTISKFLYKHKIRLENTKYNLTPTTKLHTTKSKITIRVENKIDKQLRL